MTTQHQNPTTQYQRPVNMTRPTGVTALTVLNVIMGLLMLFAAGLVFLVALGVSFVPEASVAAGVLWGIGGMSLVMGLLFMVAAYGLYTLRSWGRTLAIVMTALDLIFGVPAILSGQLVYLGAAALSVLILWYLFRPEVKAAFQNPA